MTRGLLVLLAILFVPAAVSAVDFDCRAQAFDLSTLVDTSPCRDAADLATCPVACTRPADPAAPVVCVVGAETLVPLPTTTRLSPTQPLYRHVDVRSGPFTDVVLATVAFNTIADGIFTAARDRLCVPAPPPPPSTPPPAGPPPPNPGLIGGNPGLRGGNPGLIGPDPRIRVR